MAEVVGLVASVVQLAGAGLKLSQALYQYADGVATADRRIKNIANEVKLTSLVIQELGSIFKRDETANLISENAVKTANATIKECSAVFTEIEVIVNKSKPGKMGRLMLPFRDNKIELLRSQIDKLKSTLELLMQVLIHAHQVSSNRLNREAEAKQREEIKQLLENKKQSTKKYEESLKNFSISDGSTAVDDEERSLPEDDETAPSSHLFKAASAIGSTINSETLAKCVDHVRSLLADIETLQFALAEKVNGDDHSDHHQKAIGTYFVARSHLDSVLLGNSKANISQIQSRQNTIIHNTKKSACKNSSSASSTVYENPDGGNINANTDIFDIGLNFGDDASAIEDFHFDSFQHVGAGKDKFTFGLNERERQSRDGQRIERVKMSMVSPRPRRREIDGEPIPLPIARSVDTKTMGSSYKGAAREETPLDRTLAEKDAYRTKQREGHSRIKRRDMREEKEGEEGEKGLKLEEAKRGEFTTPWQEGFPQEEFRRREGASCATRVDRFSRQRLPPPTQSSHSVRRVPRALIEERQPSVSRTVSDQITPSPEKDRIKTIPTRPLEISYYNAGKNSFASRMCVSRERPLPGTNQCHKEYEHLRSERGNERGETRANGMEKARAEERQRLSTEKEQQRRHQQDQERGKMLNERLPSRLAEKQSQAQEELLRVEKEAMVREKEVSPRRQKPQPKISLGDFLGDQTPGPWADEMEDAPIAAKTEAGGRFRSDTGSSKPSNVDEVDELLREWTTVLG